MGCSTRSKANSSPRHQYPALGSDECNGGDDKSTFEVITSELERWLRELKQDDRDSLDETACKDDGQTVPASILT